MSMPAMKPNEGQSEARNCDCCGGIHTVCKAMEIEEFTYGSGKDSFNVSLRVPIWTCSECCESYTDWEADVLRHEAVCDRLGRPSPRAIREFRNANGFSQEQLAEVGRFGIASIKRWEAGDQIPSASAAQHLELLMLPGILAMLRERDHARQIPASVPRFQTELSELSRRRAVSFQLRRARLVAAPQPAIAA